MLTYMNTINQIMRYGWDSLEDSGIKVTWHPTLPMAVLNYQQWADKFHPVTLECRGLVLDKALNILSRPMRRFFNYGEVECDRDFSTAIAYEKLDGSMITVWWNKYLNDWSISTRNSFGDAQTAWGNSFDSVVRPLIADKLVDKDYSYVFELTSPENRVITKYKDTKLTHLTSIRISDGVELSELVGFDRPLEYRFGTKDEIDKALAALPELEEGYVVKWPDNYRIKIKNPAYLAFSKSSGVHYRNSSNGALSKRRAMEVYFEGNADEYLAYYPEDAKVFDFIPVWEKFVKDFKNSLAGDTYLGVEKPRVDNVEYIKATYDPSYWGALFAFLDGKDISTYFNNLSTNNKIRLVEKLKEKSSED